MSFRFDLRKAKNIVLYVLHSLGGQTDIYRLYLLLYLADLKHMAAYGTLITGDAYIAMKFGPAPFHIMSMFKEIKEEGGKEGTGAPKLKLTEDQVVALARHELSQLAESEVSCLFETIQTYKAAPIEELTTQTTNTAWQHAAIDGEISISDMAVESGAEPEMIRYIELFYRNERQSFNDTGTNRQP